MRHNNERMWQPQHRGSQNLDSLKYTYHLSPPKDAFRGHQWRTHFDVTTRTAPTFVGSDWTKLSSTTGLGGTLVDKWLSTSDTAELVIVTPDGPKYRTTSKASITLVEHLGNGTYRVSIPIVGDPIDDAEAEVEELVEGVTGEDFDESAE